MAGQDRPYFTTLECLFGNFEVILIDVGTRSAGPPKTAWVLRPRACDLSRLKGCM